MTEQGGPEPAAASSVPVADAFPTKVLPTPTVKDMPPAPVKYRKLIGPGIIAAGVGPVVTMAGDPLHGDCRIRRRPRVLVRRSWVTEPGSTEVIAALTCGFDPVVTEAAAS